MSGGFEFRAFAFAALGLFIATASIPGADAYSPREIVGVYEGISFQSSGLEATCSITIEESSIGRVRGLHFTANNGETIKTYRARLSDFDRAVSSAQYGQVHLSDEKGGIFKGMLFKDEHDSVNLDLGDEGAPINVMISHEAVEGLFGRTSDSIHCQRLVKVR